MGTALKQSVGIPKIQAPTQTWNMDVGAVAKNLDRASSGGYGGRYGMKPTTGLYEARMAQIKGNFAAKQGQVAEEQRRLEAERAYRLQSSALGETRRSNKAAEEARAAEFEKTFGFKESELGALTDYRNRGLDLQETGQDTQADQWEKTFGRGQAEVDRDAERWQWEQQDRANAKTGSSGVAGARSGGSMSPGGATMSGVNIEAYKQGIYDKTNRALDQIRETGQYTQAPYAETAFLRSPQYRAALDYYTANKDRAMRLYYQGQKRDADKINEKAKEDLRLSNLSY